MRLEEEDFYDELPEHVKEGIQRALEDIAMGRTRPHDEVMKEIKEKYFSKNRKSGKSPKSK